MSTPEFDFGDAENYVEADDAAIDRWHDGALDALNYRPSISVDPDYLEGYAHGQTQRRVVVVMSERPEGYYHMPLGTFD